MEAIIKSFSEHGTLIESDALEYILSKDKPDNYVTLITKNLKEYPLILTLEQIKSIEEDFEIPAFSKTTQNELVQKEKEKHIKYEIYEKKQKTKTSEKIKKGMPQSSEYSSEIKIIKDVTGKSVCEGKTDDFTKLFRNRFDVLRKILRLQRREMANIIPINRINKNGIKDVQIAGIVKEVKNTSNGHRLIILEDDTAETTCIALRNDRDTISTAQEVVLDEIIGVKGQLSKNGDLFIIKNIVFPDVSIKKERNQSDDPVFAAFLSDIHIGSKQFMDDQWNAFIKWVNGDLGNSRQKNVAGKIKYLVIPGDVVDGIGIYPSQEEELSITDIYNQYKELAKQIQRIPDHISIIMQPGNHDAVRPAEPQPTFEKDIQDLFSGCNMTFIGNPCYFSLNGVEILSYHGQSLLDFATNIQQLEFNKPIEIMKMMLKKHHLSPTYGGFTPLAPEHSDYMVIDKVPDIFVTGHVHLATIGEYRGVTLINASSWQEQTEYQKMMNFIPNPGKLPIVDLQNSNVTMMDFSKKI